MVITWNLWSSGQILAFHEHRVKPGWARLVPGWVTIRTDPFISILDSRPLFVPLQISQNFVGSIMEICWKIMEICWKIMEICWTYHGNLLEVSQKFVGSITDICWKSQ